MIHHFPQDVDQVRHLLEIELEVVHLVAHHGETVQQNDRVLHLLFLYFQEEPSHQLDQLLQIKHLIKHGIMGGTVVPVGYQDGGKLIRETLRQLADKLDAEGRLVRYHIYDLGVVYFQAVKQRVLEAELFPFENFIEGLADLHLVLLEVLLQNLDLVDGEFDVGTGIEYEVEFLCLRSSFHC